MTLQEILARQGNARSHDPPDATLEDVVQKLVEHNCGSLVVCESDARSRQNGGMVGIITERDILQACAAHEARSASVRVRDVMTSDVDHRLARATRSKTRWA